MHNVHFDRATKLAVPGGSTLLCGMGEVGCSWQLLLHLATQSSVIY